MITNAHHHIQLYVGLGDPDLGSHTCVASSLPLSHLPNPQSFLFCLRLGSFLKDNYKLKAFPSEMLLLLCIRSTPLLAHNVPIKLDENSIYRALRMHRTPNLTPFFFTTNLNICLEEKLRLKELNWQRLVQIWYRWK